MKPPDYTGLKFGLLLAPVFFIFVYFNKVDVGFTVTLVSAKIDNLGTMNSARNK